jgi:hypothetical protein
LPTLARLICAGACLRILLDKRSFMSPRLEYRLRFSIAHEVGQAILNHG